MTARPQPPIEPDAVVRTALQLLPIPPHDDDFWRRLEVALDAEPPHETPAERPRGAAVADLHRPDLDRPATARALDPGLAFVPPAFRRGSNVVLGVVAAAAIVVVAIAGSTLLDERNGTTVSGPEPDPALETLVRDAQAGGTVTTLSAEREDESSEAVLAWVDDLGAGDAEGAWKVLGEASQAHFASQASFEELLPELAEDFGAWSAAEPDEVVVTPVASDDDGTIAVVTLLGTVEQDDGSQPRAAAFPVRIEDGDVVLEPFASAGPVEVVVPEPASEDGLGWEPVGADEELVFVLPSDAEAPVVQVDGGDTVICGQAEGSELGPLDQSTGQRCAYLPQGGFSAGPHTVTIAFLGADDGSITAESIRFEAA